MLRMNEHPYEQLGAAHVGREDRVRDEPSGRRRRGDGTGGGLWIHRAGAEAATIPAAAKGTERHGAPVPAQSHRPEPGADDSPDPALDGYAANRAEAGAAAEFQTALQ
jgi:hypothetical protein